MTDRGSHEKPHTILLVEDNAGDVDLVREAFSRSSMKFNIVVAIDGEEALNHLKAESENPTHPDLIMLDLNLPRMDGREVLRIVKSDHELKFIPIVVFTSSAADKDLKEAYRLSANCYITKPVELGEYFRIAQEIEDFWFRTVRLPNN